MKRHILLGVLFSCAFWAPAVLASPDEIMVYTDEMDAPGQFGLEQHLNYSISGTQVPEYPGQMPPHHVFQATPEFSYGLSNTLEAGLYLPFAWDANGYSFVNGFRLRLKYIAEHIEGQHLFWGMNVEVGENSIRVSDSELTAELRPIIGYHDADWLLSFNPIVNTGLSSGSNQTPQFEPALKLTHSIGGESWAGLEYYGAYGALGSFLPGDQVGHTLYVVCDTASYGHDVSVGLGRGVHSSDDWVGKAVVSISF